MQLLSLEIHDKISIAVFEVVFVLEGNLIIHHKCKNCYFFMKK